MRLRSPVEAFRLGLAVGIAALSLAALAAEHARADRVLRRWGLISDEEIAESAYSDLWKGNMYGADGALEKFRDAVRLNMASPYRWCDLSDAFLEVGRETEAKYCASRAVELGPLAPVTLMRAANSYFRAGEFKSALRCTSRVLALVPDYDEVIFLTYRRMGLNLEQLLSEGLPPAAPRPARAFVRSLLAPGYSDAAAKAADWAERRHLLDDAAADEYTVALMSMHRYEDAWAWWIRHLGPRAQSYQDGNHVLNGGFEYPNSGTVFDWRIRDCQGVTTGRDSKVVYEGRSSLRIEFTGTDNVRYTHISQATVLRPGTYLFQARLKAEDVTTDEGIRFRILDAEKPARLDVATANITGSTDWLLIQQPLTVKLPTRLVEVYVTREPSTRFDSEISGRIWIDDVRLIALPPGAQARPRT